MNRSALVLLVSLLIAAAQATNHTMCFNYFMQNDKCVYASADARTRCEAPPKQHSTPVKQFALATQSSGHRLARRYDTTKNSMTIAGGNGICGNYNTTEELGVCLWSGPFNEPPTLYNAGWLNGVKTSNCNKRIYIQRTGQPDTVQFAKVLDGCSFYDTEPVDGCFQIGITTQLFHKFNLTKYESDNGVLVGGITWDFDNIKGLSTQQAPI